MTLEQATAFRDGPTRLAVYNYYNRRATFADTTPELRALIFAWADKLYGPGLSDAQLVAAVSADMDSRTASGKSV